MDKFWIGRLVLAACLVCLPPCCRADIYGYIDETGIGHFSTQKMDERYQLFLKGSQSFDSSQLPRANGALDPGRLNTPLFRYLSQHPNLKKYTPLLDQAAKQFALDPALLKAVMAAESGFNPGAVSPKGAIGLMQVMPATAQRYGLQPDKKQTVEQKLADPRTNILLGAHYLHDLLKLFPANQDLVLASYNAGEGAVQKFNNQIPPYPETRNYVQLVTQFYQLYKPEATAAPGIGINPRRIQMTIPGRRNLPAAPLTTSEQPDFSYD